MSSIRHNPLEVETSHDPDAPYLDAAREAILAVGWRRATLTDIAKRAGVSRMTVYRRWSDMQTLLADLLVREWSALIDEALLQPDAQGSGLSRLSHGVVRTVRALRENDLFCKIVEVDPELLLPYLLERRGRNQDQVLAVLRLALTAGQADGSVRAGDPDLLAGTLLLTLHGFVLSAETLQLPLDDVDDQLTLLIERYLAP